MIWIEEEEITGTTKTEKKMNEQIKRNTNDIKKK